MKGWVYVISNRAMPDLVKVGFSTKDPKLRAEELGHTGSPHPYVVEYEVLVEDPMLMEQEAHRLLSAKHEAKEWFRCSTEMAVSAIRKCVGSRLIIENLFYVDRAGLAALDAEEEVKLAAEAEKVKRRRELEQITAQEAMRLDVKKKEIASWLELEVNKINDGYADIIADHLNDGSVIKYIGDLWVAWYGWFSVISLAVLACFSYELILGELAAVLVVVLPVIAAVYHVDYRKEVRREAADRAREEARQRVDAFKYRSTQCKVCGSAIRHERAAVVLQPSANWHCTNCKSPVEVPQDCK